jgi:HEXXH motif-containing protein
MSASDTSPAHRLSGAEFDSLGRGHGNESALATLRSAQLSKRILLLVAAHRAGGLDDAAWSLLREITTDRPGIRDDLLTHPFIDTWATHHLRQPADARPASGGYLSGLAVAAAIRAGVDLDLRIAAPRGELYVPTIGLAYGLGARPVAARVRDGGLTLAGADSTITVPAAQTTDAPGWWASRDLTVRSPAGSLTLTIEDLDPHRSCFGHRVTPRLTSAQVAQLESLVDDAWRLIATDYPEHATAILRCVRSLVPLVPPDIGSASASSQNAFGAVALSAPDSAAEVALLLIHEAQHLKLGAVLDFTDLLNPRRDGLFYAPWRADPRPPRALFQGVYAHAGVADFWRVRRTRTTGAEARTADFEFAYWLAQTRLAASALAGSRALTAHGERFLGQLTTTLDAWATLPVDSPLQADIDDLMTAVAVRWRLDNHQPETGILTRLAAAWWDGHPCPAIGPPSVAPAERGGPAPLDGLTAQVHARLTATRQPAADRAGAAYLEGRTLEAIEAYRAAAMAVPDDAVAWVGLALAVRAGGDADAARALAERPDLVRATFARLRAAGREAAPDELAAWLAAGLR